MRGTRSTSWTTSATTSARRCAPTSRRCARCSSQPGIAAEGARGVAVFACGPAGLLEVVRVPHPLPAKVVIDDSPFVEPLLRALGRGALVRAARQPPQRAPVHRHARAARGDRPVVGQRPLPAPPGRLVAAALRALGRGGRARPPRPTSPPWRSTCSRREDFEHRADRRAAGDAQRARAAAAPVSARAARGPRAARRREREPRRRSAAPPPSGSRSSTRSASARCSSACAQGMGAGGRAAAGRDDVLAAWRRRASRRCWSRSARGRARDREGARDRRRGDDRPAPRPGAGPARRHRRTAALLMI